MPDTGKIRHRRRQRLTDGGLRRGRPVAALVQTCAGRVDHQARKILPQKELHLPDRAGLLEPLDGIFPFEALDNRLLDDRLAVRHAGELGVDTGALDGERVPPADPALPRQCAHALEQLVEAARGEGAHPHQHPLPIADAQVGARDHLRPSGKENAAVLRPHVRRTHPPKLPGEGPFQPEQARRHKLNPIRFHKIGDRARARSPFTRFPS